MDGGAYREFDGTLAAIGDILRVRTSPETSALGLAGLTGEARGQSIPSVSGVEVIGRPIDDWAIHVHFGECDAGHWFAPHLLSPSRPSARSFGAGCVTERPRR